MKILVTGSSGHLGEALVRTLKTTNNEVVGVDVMPSDFTDQLGSIVDRDYVRRCISLFNHSKHKKILIGS